jgi:SSS family solute:Na+ symporter
MTIDYAIVLIYLLGILALGLYTSRGIRNLQEYAVAGRNYPAMIIFATLSASFIGGGFTLGNAEKVFLFGIVNVLALWGFSCKEVLVSIFIAPKMDRFRHAISVGDIMQEAYGTKSKIISGVFAVLLCMGIVGAQVGAIGYVFEVFLGMPRMVGILLGCGIVIVYVTLGGMKAVVLTDVAQFLILVIGLPLALYFGMQQVGGWSVVMSNVPSNHLSLLGEMPVMAFISLFLVFLLGETLVPPYLQRLLIGKDAKAVARGTLWSGLFSFPFFFISGAIGLVALTMAPDLNPNLAIPYVVQTALPVGISGLVVAAIICVVMSSADSFLNSAAVAFSNDIVKPLKRKPLGEKQELLLAKIVTFTVGILAIVFAIKIQSVLDILVYSYHFWAPIVLVPLIAAIFGYKASCRHFITAGTCSVAAMLGWTMLLQDPYGIDGLVIGVIVNAVAMYICSVPLGCRARAVEVER